MVCNSEPPSLTSWQAGSEEWERLWPDSEMGKSDSHAELPAREVVAGSPVVEDGFCREWVKSSQVNVCGAGVGSRSSPKFSPGKEQSTEHKPQCPLLTL